MCDGAGGRRKEMKQNWTWERGKSRQQTGRNKTCCEDLAIPAMAKEVFVGDGLDSRDKHHRNGLIDI